MLNAEEKKLLYEKLDQLKKDQAKERKKWMERRNLNKDGDENWNKYVKKQLRWRDRYERLEWRRARLMYVRALYNKRKGKMSPMINI
jgi:hypothetical protein